MSDFVEECRREWKRLRVPDPVADEMAADLAADLKDAAADGVSAEEFLGTGADDARSFAAYWAAERGVVEPRPGRDRLSGRSLVLGAIAASLSIAAVAAGIAILATPASATSALPVLVQGAGTEIVRFSAAPAPVVEIRKVDQPGVWVAAVQDGTQTGALPPAQAPNRRSIAWILLSAGIVGIALTTLYWSMVSRRQRA